MSASLRCGLIGLGRAGRIHAGNLAQRIPGAELTAVCDLDAQAVEDFAGEFDVAHRFTDYRAAVTDPSVDAVVIVTPTFLHCEMAVAAAEAGRHIFLEKPMALSVAECRQIIAAADRAGVRLQIGFMRRFDAGFRRAKALLESGEFGRVLLVKSTGRGPGGPGPWMYDLSQSNGIVAEVNSHDLDSLFWFTGARLKRVYAEAHNFKCPDARDSHPDFYDNVLAQFRFHDDTLGVVDGACPAHYGYDARVEILCERGVIFVGSAREHGVTHITVDGQVCGEAVASWRGLFREAYAAEMADFVAAVHDDRPTSVTGADGLAAVEAVLAVNESIRTGQPVVLHDA